MARVLAAVVVAGLVCATAASAAPPPSARYRGKTSQHLNLSKVWRRAARELSQAENIFVIGYSMPPSDAFFKYLYALGTVGKTRIRRFWVWNPDPTVGQRFRELIGPGVHSKFQFIQDTFSSAIDAIERQFQR